VIEPHPAPALAGLLLAALLAAATTAAWLVAERGPAFPPPPPRAPVPVAALPRSAPLDLNAADAEALARLPGIGTVLARRIVAHREAQGRFRRAEELREVPGIGPGRWERLRPLVAVGGA
jgi:competence protein ComEA